MALADLIGIPFDQLFQGLLLPVLIVFAILWALLNSMKVFNRKINTVLAAALTLMVATTPQFTLFTAYIAQLGAQVAIAAFFLLFAFGTIVWVLGRGRDIVYEQTGLTRDKINKLLAKYYKKYKEAKEEDNKGKMKAALDEIKRLEMERDVAD